MSFAMLLNRFVTSSCRSIFRDVSRRGLSVTSGRLSAYDNDGKTTATVLNQELGSNIMIDSYSITGFRLNNGMYVIGPVAVFPKSILGWNVKDDHDISEDSLTLFTLLQPKLDILVIGYGSKTFERNKLDKELLKLRRKYQLNIELLPTDRAIATYNFLVSECRWVAAALLPPQVVALTDADMAVPRRKQETTSTTTQA